MKKLAIIFAALTLSASACFAQPGVTLQDGTQQSPATEGTQQSSTQQSSAQPTRKQLGSFTIAPARPNKKNPSTIYAEMKPGDTYKDSLFFENNNDVEITLHLYAGDETTTEQGKFSVKNMKEPREMFGKWTQLETEEITLSPGEKKEVAFTIQIPPELPLGEYKGGICAVRDADAVQGGVAYSTRYVLGAKILVTDNPQHVWKMGEINIFESGTMYFLGSVVLFVAGMGYFAWGSLKERKKKKQLTSHL